MTPEVSITGLMVAVVHDVDGRRVLERRRGIAADTWPAATWGGAQNRSDFLSGQWHAGDQVIFDLGPIEQAPVLGGSGSEPTAAQFDDLIARLRALHQSPIPATVPSHRPDLIERLLAWHGRQPQAAGPGTAALHDRLRAYLGQNRLDRIIEVAASWPEDGSGLDGVLLHGFASLGQAVLFADGGAAWLESGHARTGPVEYDFGVLLGDAAELGLGSTVDVPAGLDRAAVLAWAGCRLLAHMVDFARFVGEAPDLDRYVALLAAVANDPEALFRSPAEERR